ncbi:MFS transporter [Marinobacterium sp. D7]|uniref:MFS transporter n=1 Tax=Marinobacterium ramblicola TaxID=2849041 RepID=UPI001C2D21AB|nr:MFS transporter [Marinobacterium ramblicola]MBV1789941.1 MFS transporter [Marinobacterium ramblicola]
MSEVNTVPRQATGRREGAVIMAGSSLTIMGAVMVAPILPKLGAEFGPIESNADVLVPIAITGPALAIALFAPVAGWLADRVGRKNLLVIATLLYALLGAIPALLNDLQAIVGVRLLFGCTEAAIMTCCATLIADYWRGEERFRYVNYQVVTIGVVGALFFVIGGALGEHSWRTPFYLYILPILLVPLMMKVLWEPRHHAESTNSNDPEQVNFWALLVGYILVCAGMILNFIVPVQSPALLVSMGITSSTLIGAASGLGLLATLAGALFWPLLRRRLGIRGCNALLLALIAVGLWLLAGAQSYNGVLVAVFIHGVGAGLLVPNVMAPVMNALTAATRGRGMGGFTASLYIGQFVSPLVVAGMLAQGGDLRSVIATLSYASLAGAGVWLLARLIPGRAAQGAANSSMS